MKPSYGSSASSAAGILVILTWFMKTLCDQLARYGVIVPIEVQAAIIGLVMGPLLKWLQKEGIDVTDAPAVPPGTPPAPEVPKPAA